MGAQGTNSLPEPERLPVEGMLVTDQTLAGTGVWHADDPTIIEP